MLHTLTFAQEVTATGRWGRLAQRGIDIHADPAAGEQAVALTVFGRHGSTDRVRIEVPWDELDRLADVLRVLARSRRASAGDSQAA